MDNIKSYVTRLGKISKNKKTLYQNEGFRFVFDKDKIDFYNKIVEIGFGKGDSLLNYSQKFENLQFVGCEMYQNGIYTLANQCYKNSIKNIQIIQHDAYLLVSKFIPNNSIRGFNIFFPDPWHKKKHNKRRLLKPEFLKMLKTKLFDEGYIYIITDNDNYAVDISNSFLNLGMQKEENHNMMKNRSLTSFEKKALEKNHIINEFFYIKV